MVKHDWTQFIDINGGKYICIPKKVVEDKEFPFSLDKGKPLLIRIAGKNLVIEGSE